MLRAWVANWTLSRPVGDSAAVPRELDARSDRPDAIRKRLISRPPPVVGPAAAAAFDPSGRWNVVPEAAGTDSHSGALAVDQRLACNYCVLPAGDSRHALDPAAAGMTGCRAD